MESVGRGINVWVAGEEWVRESSECMDGKCREWSECVGGGCSERSECMSGGRGVNAWWRERSKYIGGRRGVTAWVEGEE